MLRNLIPIDVVDQRYGRLKTSVLVNASPRQIIKFAATVPERQLRGTACDGRLVVYPAWDATHLQIRDFFGFPDVLADGTDFWIIPEDADPLSSDWGASDDNPIRSGMRFIVGRRDGDPAIAGLVEWFNAEVLSSSIAP